MDKQIIFLCAGGTGGHLFPAEAVAHALTEKGYGVHLAADERVERYAHNFPADAVHKIPSATLSFRQPLKLLKGLWSLLMGYLKARSLFKKIQPVAVVGFGGYPTLPPLLAACHLNLPTLVHEANAVLGRANGFLAPRVKKIAIGFENASVFNNQHVEVTGNPVRPAILDAAQHPYAMCEAGDNFNLLIFGGSQGARFFSEIMPQALERLPRETLDRLRIVQQARQEDLQALKANYKTLGINAQIAPFFDDMAEEIKNAHYVISRAGASTVSELSVIGRPALLVPFPFALDHDQANNAKSYQESGGAELVLQRDLSPQRLADILRHAIENPKLLAKNAASAKTSGKPDATERLVRLITEMV